MSDVAHHASEARPAEPKRIRVVRLESHWIQPLLQMLETVDRRLFHPHPFSREAIEPLIGSLDEYWLLLRDDVVVGYGMLRGWEQGYAIPSLGIAVAADCRGHGHGETLARFLHSRAVARGATRVRLTVEPDNYAAHGLYRKLGYAPESDGPWFMDLPRPPSSPGLPAAEASGS